jgi:hypothetical protein
MWPPGARHLVPDVLRTAGVGVLLQRGFEGLARVVCAMEPPLCIALGAQPLNLAHGRDPWLRALRTHGSRRGPRG